MIAHATRDGLHPRITRPGSRRRLPHLLALAAAMALEDSDPIVIATHEGSEIDRYMQAHGFTPLDLDDAGRADT